MKRYGVKFLYFRLDLKLEFDSPVNYDSIAWVGYCFTLGDSMFDALIKILSIVFKPLFDTSKETILKSTDPGRKMTRSLIKLYDQLEAIEFWSDKLLVDAETYISKPWVAWTVARSKREQLIRSSNELKKATIGLGSSLKELYSMFSIQHQELLAPLIGIYNFKGSMMAEPQAAPEIINVSDDPKVAALRLIQPKSDLEERELSALIRQFHFDSKEIGKNYLVEIDIDRDKEQVAELIKQSRPILAHIGYTKAQLREFIQKNVSIEDFFK